ncbi:hypothetical protein NEUTE1DRAFT_101903 [Neurospora tetrasperma FGSC 2508]|uniref:Uncharacterized protein n=1 Tax=Neurospora tetrasperma (strain FGSC 2508 / ATCC MYA-4615 / P0657) TaxID=510951 RepID=F8MQJ9_NEUT8|nr:uncharacterized protein NEUTE1DRAFT_101903 [Neurospora tetrasperma FGSC 2508]EGO56629.1 hypothetical protein NEUTE1DRAFT_101903 [Neurospora tetrasperma FGSC 2508]
MSVSYVIAHSIGRNAMTAGSLERKRVRRCVDLGGRLWLWRSRTNGGYWIRTSRSGSLPSAGSRSALWVPVSRHPPSRLPQPDKVHRSGSLWTLPRLALCPTIVQLSLRTRTTAGCYWLAPRCRTISGMRVRSPPGEFNVPRLCRRRGRRRWAGAGMPFVRRTRQTGWRGAGLTILCHAI